MAESPGDASRREVRISHLLAAPRDLVFRAWTDEAEVARWWVPDEFRVVPGSVRVEPRVGGAFRMEWESTTGGPGYAVRAEFVELVEPELIVLRHEAIPEAGILEQTITRVTLGPEGEHTRLEIVDGPYTEEMEPNATAGWRALVAKLERLVAP